MAYSAATILLMRSFMAKKMTMVKYVSRVHSLFELIYVYILDSVIEMVNRGYYTTLI